MSSAAYILTTAVLAHFAFGCLGCGPNHSYFRKGNVQLSGQIRSGQIEYTHLRVGTPQSPLSDGFLLFIRLPDGNVVSTRRLTEADIRPLAHRVGEAEYLKEWPDGSERLYVGAYSFVACEGKILNITASTVTLKSSIKAGAIKGTYEENVPQIGIDPLNLFKMPFSRTDAVNLFGEPDKIDDIWHS